MQLYAHTAWKWGSEWFACVFSARLTFRMGRVTGPAPSWPNPSGSPSWSTWSWRPTPPSAAIRCLPCSGLTRMTLGHAAALSQALYQLRKSLGSTWIENIGDHLLRIDRTEISCDALEFKECVAAGRVRAALDLYRGPFMEAFHVSDAREFSQWVGRVAGGARSGGGGIGGERGAGCRRRAACHA